MEEGQTPPVEQHVVVAPDDLMVIIAEGQNGDPHQRVALKVEAAAHVLLLTGLNALRLRRLRQVTQIRHRHLKGSLLEDDLQGTGEILMEKRGPQHCMAAGQRIPAPSEGIKVQGAGQAIAHLHKIGGRIRIVEGLKEQPLLHGRQGIDVVNL